MVNVKWTWDTTRHNPKVVIHTDAASDPPVMKVNDTEITLYDPDIEDYDVAHYHCVDIAGDSSQWLITSPAASSVSSSDTWEIADSFNSLKYRVEYGPATDNTEVTDDLDDLTYTQTGLDTGTEYVARVQSYVGDVDSAWTDWVYVTTLSTFNPAWAMRSNNLLSGGF